MDTPATLDVNYDEEHQEEGVGQLGALEDQTGDHEHGLPDAGGSPDGIFWGILAAFCILAGLSIGLALYLKRNFALSFRDLLRQCCSKLTGAGTHDPVLLNVTGGDSKEGLDKDGAEGDKHSEGSSSDEEEGKGGKGGEKEESDKVTENSTTTKVTFHKSDTDGDGDGAEPSENKAEGAAAAAAAAATATAGAEERGTTDDAVDEAEGRKGNEETKESAAEESAAAVSENKENEETKGEAKETQENEKQSRRSSSSSSSSSSSDEDESSVRQRKNATAEGAPEGDTAAAPEQEEHKE